MTTTLDQVVTAFQHWRTTRLKRGPIPKELIAQTIGLSTRYSKSEITGRLGINHSMLNRWMEKQSEDNTFITLPIANIEPTKLTTSNSLEISIRFTHGAQLTLTGMESKAASFISELQQRGAL